MSDCLNQMADNICKTDDSIEGLSDSDGQNEGYGPTIMNLNANKAGMAGVDSHRINKVIHEWSNGSNFHSFQKKRQKRIDDQICEMKRRLNQMTEWQRILCLKESDVLSKAIEAKRVFNRIVVHIDLDMFFAAVEIKHRPELADKPIAIGSDQMLATSNYVARKYGVRPAMPGALARQLCPQLIILKHSFGSYSEESKEVMKIISEFDPNFCCVSLDEAYIDLTDYVFDVYCHQNNDLDINSLKQTPELPQPLWDFAAQVVAQMRQRILTETQLSASAGIACNAMIAKVCSDVNKPNGQHMIRGNAREIEEFLEKTSVRKVCGIGPVRGQYLTALDITTCKDLWHKRDIIRFLFSQFNAEYYLKVGLGVGSHVIMRDEEQRKSISSERTVGQISDFNAICDILKEMSDELVSDLNTESQSCKTVTIKLKKISFEVSLKSQSLPFHTCDSETILNAAKKLLNTELANTAVNNRKYRLIGLKVSNLKSNGTGKAVGASQMTLSQIFSALKSDDNCKADSSTSDYVSHCSPNSCVNEVNSTADVLVDQCYESDPFECSVCFQTFKHKNLFESHENECIEQMLSLCPAQEPEFEAEDPDTTGNSAAQVESIDLGAEACDERGETSAYLCPICSLHLAVKGNDELNRHIDLCLNKGKCQELTQVPFPLNSTPNKKIEKRVYSESKVNAKSRQNCKKQRKQSSFKSQKTIDFFFHSQ